MMNPGAMMNPTMMG